MRLIPGRDRMDFQIAEAAREGDVLLLADVLIAEEYDLVGQQCRTDVGDRFVSEGLAQIDTLDFRADPGGQRRDAEAGEAARLGERGHGILP
jgi:uncharacterized protein YaiI (UPF0178 family)